jgi:aminoglycoside phosphotransferase (APT) family kinase protein
MKLPPPVDLSTEALHAIAARHGLRADRVVLLPATGIINTVYLLGERHVLRVPRDHPGHVEQARREALAVPAARQAGVRTPRLVAFDDSLDLAPVPYTLYERVRGVALGPLDLESDGAAEVWRELGRDLARLHVGVAPGGPADALGPGRAPPDPRPMVDARASEGWFTAVEARWLEAWLDRLAPLATRPVPDRLLHGDTQATNVMVGRRNRGYRALIDWGGARWGDPALDCCDMPMRAVPHVLAGHREVARFDDDDLAEARLIWGRLVLVLRFLPRGAVPEGPFAERPVALLLETLRFFLGPAEGRWRGLGPPE